MNKYVKEILTVEINEDSWEIGGYYKVTLESKLKSERIEIHGVLKSMTGEQLTFEVFKDNEFIDDYIYAEDFNGCEYNVQVIKC